jgi:hypothetical protein
MEWMSEGWIGAEYQNIIIKSSHPLKKAIKKLIVTPETCSHDFRVIASTHAFAIPSILYLQVKLLDGMTWFCQFWPTACLLSLLTR